MTQSSAHSSLSSSYYVHPLVSQQTWNKNGKACWTENWNAIGKEKKGGIFGTWRREKVSRLKGDLEWGLWEVWRRIYTKWAGSVVSSASAEAYLSNIHTKESAILEESRGWAWPRHWGGKCCCPSWTGTNVFICTVVKCKCIHLGNIWLLGSHFLPWVAKGPVGETKHDD